MFRIFTIACCCLCTIAVAQVKTDKKPAGFVPVNKFKPPVVTTSLAKFSGKDVRINAEVGKQIISLPLRITDAKNNVYALSSYQFAYKRVGVKENEETGETSPATDYRADRFTSTPLPALWITNIAEQLHKGEELWFFDVIAKDAQGRLFFAPDLKIVIE